MKWLIYQKSINIIGTKTLANLEIGAPIADKIGWNLGQLLVTALWTFGLPHKIPGPEYLVCTWH